MIFGMKPLQDPAHKFTHLEDTSYNAFAKTSWTIALIWIVIACTYEYGGIRIISEFSIYVKKIRTVFFYFSGLVNMFLSWRIWEIVGKLSYAMFLVHVPIQFLLASVNKNVSYFSNFSTVSIFFFFSQSKHILCDTIFRLLTCHSFQVYMFFGDILFILFISYILTITFELPVITLEKVIFRNG